MMFPCPIQKQTVCRVCTQANIEMVIDFGLIPLADQLCETPADTVPSANLSLYICRSCKHLQIGENVAPDILFHDHYPYHSSKIPELQMHFQQYAQQVANEFNLGSNDQIVEIACNDGLLLNYFKEWTPFLLGVEPALGPAQEAQAKGLKVINQFFSKRVAAQLIDAQKTQPKIILANNVLAHVPDVNDFCAGISVLANEQSVVVVEVPYVIPMLEQAGFDVIFHQHYSYFTLHSLIQLWKAHGLHIFNITPVETQGGSLRIYLSKTPTPVPVLAEELLQKEVVMFSSDDALNRFTTKIERLKNSLQTLMIQLHEKKCKVVGYGAPGKAATLLNYFEFKREWLAYLVDISPSKQNKFFPTANFPIYSIDRLMEDKPDYILILAWNYAPSIIDSLRQLGLKHTRFILIHPDLMMLH